jgi:hypothetical protein
LVHGLAPSVDGTLERPGGACRATAAVLGSPNRLQALNSRVLRLADCIIKIELSGKVPLAVVRVGATDIISVKGGKRLFRGGAGSTRVEELHEKIKLSKGFSAR